MKTNKTHMERVIASVGSIFVFVSFLASIFLDGDKNSILELIPIRFNGHPFTSILLPVLHGTTFIIGLSCVIKPGIKREYTVLLVESCITILTNYEQLGIFFFYVAVVLIIIDFQFSKKAFIISYILCVIHVICILLIYTHGWAVTFVALFTSFFYGTFFISIYKFLKSEFCLVPANVTENEILKTVRGKTLSLSDFKLSERQINLVYDCLNDSLNYKDLSEKYFISVSTVKKDFTDVFHVFNVDNLNELKMLLIQFQITK